MLDLQEKQRTLPKSAAEPAKSWRNWYRVYHVLNLGRVGPWFPGIHAGPDTFPSKDIADEHAILFLNELNPPGRYLMDHAGAYPDGADPRRNAW